MWKKYLALAAAAVLILLSGCQPAGETSSGPAVLREVTEQEELARLWQDYLGLAVVPLQQEFASPQEVDLGQLSTYCWYSYARQHGGTGELAPAGDGSYILPAEEMMQLLERYFNWKPESLKDTSPQSFYGGIRYDPEAEQFFVWPPDNEFILPGYPSGGENPWGIVLERFCYNTDGTATAVLAQESMYLQGEVGSRDIYTLGVRENGELYFLSMQTEYVPTNLANFTGEYTPLPLDIPKQWLNQPYGIQGLSTDDGLILATWVSQKSGLPLWQLRCYDTENWQLTGELDLEMAEDWRIATDLKYTGQELIFICTDSVYRIAKDLSSCEKIPLPDPLAQAIASQEGFFSGYAVTEDLSLWLWCDDEGLQLLDASTGEVRCLLKNTLSTSDKFGTMGHQVLPEFLDGGRLALTLTAAYENYSSINLVPVSGGEATELPASEWDILPAGGQGFFLLRQEDWQVIEHQYYSYQTRQLQPLRLLANEQEQQILSRLFATGNTIAFVSGDRDYQREDAAQHLWTLDATTGTLTDTGVSITAAYGASFEPLAVLPDGRVVVHYNVTPAERGIILVP